MVRSTISSLFITFIKTFSWKSLTENQVKGHIYLGKLVTGPIYVIKYIFFKEIPQIRISTIVASFKGLMIFVCP